MGKESCYKILVDDFACLFPLFHRNFFLENIKIIELVSNLLIFSCNFLLSKREILFYNVRNFSSV